jgi:hypothetical protein
MLLQLTKSTGSINSEIFRINGNKLVKHGREKWLTTSGHYFLIQD